jgi:tetratricopeptide (TPR) repeat protein
MQITCINKTFIFPLFVSLIVISCGTIPVPGREAEPVLVPAIEMETGVSQAIVIDESQSRKEDSFGTETVDSKKTPLPENMSRAKPVPLEPVVIRDQSEVTISSATQQNTSVSADSTKNKTVVFIKNDEQIKYEQARKHYDSGNYSDAMVILEALTNQHKDNLKYRDLLVMSYTKYAGYLVTEADLLEAQTILEKAISIQPYNRDLQRQLKELENRREAERQYDLGVKALESSDRDKAIDAFNKVLELKPEHELANKQLAEMRTRYIDSYQKKAMTLYRKQELDASIEAWGRVLALDPENELAKLYRARAIELKVKLERFSN